MILCYNDEQHFSEDQVLFVNTTITKTITSVVKHHPEMQKKLDDLQTIFPNYLKHYDFLKIPMFVRKMTNEESNKTESTQGSQSTLSRSKDSICKVPSNVIERQIYSLHDLITSAFSGDEDITKYTFQIELPFEQSIDDTQYFSVQIVDSMVMNDRACKMIQLVDISKNVQYDEAIQQKQFASMLNATVSHEMRGPIGSISQNIDQC